MSMEMFGRLEKQFTSNERKIVKFAVGNIQCAVDIMHVREIIQPRPTAPLPSADPSIVGVVDHRYAAIPVIDLHTRFGLQSNRVSKRKWIILSIHNRNVAIIVDLVYGVSSVQRNQKRDHSSLEEGTQMAWAKRVYGDEDGLLFEIDLNTLSNAPTGAQDR